MTQPATTQLGTIYHWIITVRFADGVHAQLSDVVEIAGPITRAEVFAWAQQKIFKQLGTDKVCVVFFDLAPNNIIPGGAS